MRSLFGTLSGVALFVWMVLRHRSLYRGMRAFYRRAQAPPSPSQRIAAACLSGPLAQLATDYRFAQEARPQARLSSRAIAEYSDDSLQGYGDATFTKGGSALEQQQRGLILPLLERVLTEAPAGRRVIEIGTGNGDVVAHLAERFPQHQFIGVDFSVKNACATHAATGARFIPGYALDLFASGQLAGDIVFGSSTFVVFTPAELRAYVQRFRAAGVTDVVLNEPSWGGCRVEPNAATVSEHLEAACWFHQYAAYFREGGYTTRHLEGFHYHHPVSQRPDIWVTRLWAAVDVR